MANIDVTTIEGFENMTSDEKVEALLKLDIPEKVDLSGYIPKAQFDRTASELSEAKKQVKAKMTEEEAAKAQSEQAMKDLQEKYNELLKTSTIATHTAKFMAMGYEEKLAHDTATALFDGDMDKVFTYQQKAQEALEKKLKAELMKQVPHPDGAGSGGGDDKEPANITLAKMLGKRKQEAQKKSDDIMKYYQ